MNWTELPPIYFSDKSIKQRLQWESEMHADFRSFQIISLIGFPKLQIFIFYPVQKELCDNIAAALRHRRHCEDSQNKLGGGSYSSWRMHRRKWRGNRLSQQDTWRTVHDCGQMMLWQGDQIVVNPKHWYFFFLTRVRWFAPSHSKLFVWWLCNTGS